jgi:hypothetical protein
VLSRHGSRDPTAGKSAAYNETISRIHSSVTEYGKGYEFIKDYVYALGADQLSGYGKAEMASSGSAFYRRYHALAQTASPFIRSSGQERVVVSAMKWAEGYYGTKLSDHPDQTDDGYSGSIVVIPEDDGVNNTLSHSLCTAFEDEDEYGSIGSDAQDEFREIFGGPIRDRLNKHLPGANLSVKEAVYIMDLCPFETVARKDAKLSQFCFLFTLDEWKDFDYYQSIGKYYGYNKGNPLGPTQGVGFVNELIARLMDQPVEDHTTTNSTLDSSPQTFPLGKALYADFSHDNDLTGIYGALGLYNETPPLSKKKRQSIKHTRGYSASWTVPFGARMYVEKMVCGAHQTRRNGHKKEHKKEPEKEHKKELVRILVNDRVVPLQDCGPDKLGRCTLESFINSLGFARSGGLWDKCFE